MDASNLGEKYKEGKNQKTKLSYEEINKIINCFNNFEEIEKFSICVSKQEIISKKLSFSAGQYFKIKIEYKEFTKEEFIKEINDITTEINSIVIENEKLMSEINENIKKVKYYENDKD